jgi:regulator of protease activity HflC (stomatin/prohibitin superfamily)
MDLLLFILALALLLLGPVLLLFSLRLPGRAAPEPARQRMASPRAGAALLGLLAALLGLTMLFLDSFTTIGARGVGVQTAFGKVQGKPLGPGWHWVEPWNNVEEFDASVQTLKFYQVEKDDDGDCITVRLANNTIACVDVTAQWNINHLGDVNGLYLQYKTFDNIHDNLVERQLGSALNEVFGTYDPLAVVAGTNTANPDPSQVVNTKDLQEKVKQALQADLHDQIQIVSVTIPVVHFDADTESRLKAYQQAKADTRIAEQNKLTAQQQALAAKELAAQSALKDPGVQYQNCLNLIDKLAREGQLGNLPPTFTCGTAGSAPNILLQPNQPTQPK